MDDYQLDFKERMWILEAPAPWYLITVPENISKEIKKEFGHLHRGWGSIPVEVHIGGSIWKTSIFWEKKGTYVFTVKKEIRAREKLIINKLIDVSLKLKVGV